MSSNIFYKLICILLLSSSLSKVVAEVKLDATKNPRSKIYRNIFLAIECSKSECYLGEPVEVFYKLYSSIEAKSTISKEPLFEGFAVYKMNEFVPLAETTERIKGKVFKVLILKHAVLVPLLTGELKLGPMELKTSAQFARSNANLHNNVFDNLLAEESQVKASYAVNLTNKLHSINVLPAPALNRPAEFSGAIGTFSISASLKAEAIENSSLRCLEVKISGKGYMPFVEAPHVNWPNHLEIIGEPVEREFVSDTVGLSGSKTFSFRFFSKRQGTYTIPPVGFTFFNSSTGLYETVKSQSVEVSMTGKDLYIPDISKRTASPQGKVTSEGSGSNFWLKLSQSIMIFFLAAMIIIVVAINKREARIKSKQVEPTVEIDPLITVRKHIEAEEFTEAYANLYQLLTEAVTYKLMLAPSECNKTLIADRLRVTGWVEPMIEKFLSIMEVCERNMYISSYVHNDEVSMDCEAVAELLQYAASDKRLAPITGMV